MLVWYVLCALTAKVGEAVVGIHVSNVVCRVLLDLSDVVFWQVALGRVVLPVR